MFILALFASLVTLSMIFAAPLSQQFRDLPYDAIWAARARTHREVDKIVAAFSTRRDMPAIIMPSNAGSTMRGLPAVQPVPEDAGVFVDAGVRCHASITYTPKF